MLSDPEKLAPNEPRLLLEAHDAVAAEAPLAQAA